MALANMEFKRPKLVSFGKKEKREEKKRKKMGEPRSSKPREVWNFGFLVWKPTLIMNSMRFGMYLWA